MALYAVVNASSPVAAKSAAVLASVASFAASALKSSMFEKMSGDASVLATLSLPAGKRVGKTAILVEIPFIPAAAAVASKGVLPFTIAKAAFDAALFAFMIC